MKLFFCAILLLTLITPAGVVVAHSDHGVISPQSAIQIASKTVRQMIFKDMGYKAGQLDTSWKSVPIEDIEVVDVRDGVYVVSATNKETMGSVYFKIAANGKVLEARDTNSF
ncbi:DUF6488 family protein [Haliea sp. E1-2-M8]|uniref:DUF6488 family protein n=1 Tax=Haliea sp. E1-2-M8 TaxID=3064706 RepID=UPI00271AA526|nr:DUF6488 family protein [Haliea sp. E1-2-M8]MDO8862060.1 DUF6488 family protein [Haliea sp. E1-2-M8]